VLLLCRLMDASDARALSVLILEDHHLVRRGMQLMIQMTEPRATIKEAASFQDAIGLLESVPFDLAFLDIDLQGERTGLDVLRHIRSSNLDTQAIMLSGRDDKETVLGCIDAGASGFIPKADESEDVFRRALDTIFQGSIFLPTNVLGRGGYSPTLARPQASAEDLGIKGRPLEALYWACQGLPNKGIANRMGIDDKTVRQYMTQVFTRFRVARRTELLVEIARRGIVVPMPQSAGTSSTRLPSQPAAAQAPRAF
jgi:two-component system, NarL family, nitrate/nitrite response regulator NarL